LFFGIISYGKRFGMWVNEWRNYETGASGGYNAGL
jgi:hypothetical protein